VKGKEKGLLLGYLSQLMLVLAEEEEERKVD